MTDRTGSIQPDRHNLHLAKSGPLTAIRRVAAGTAIRQLKSGGGGKPQSPRLAENSWTEFAARSLVAPMRLFILGRATVCPVHERGAPSGVRASIA